MRPQPRSIGWCTGYPCKVLSHALSLLRRLLDKYKVWERQQQQPADVGGMEDAEDSLTPAEKESTERTKNRITKLVGLSAHTAGLFIPYFLSYEHCEISKTVMQVLAPNIGMDVSSHTIVYRLSAHGHSPLNPRIPLSGCLPDVLGAYDVFK